jgi:protein SCO1/2
MQKRGFIITLLALLGLLVWLVFGWQPKSERENHPLLVETPRGGDFTLSSDQGPVSLSDFRGQVVLIYFGYTWCPDICPTSLSLIGAVMDSLTAEERSRVQPLFISVDPERDTLERLKSYVSYFNPELVGLTGSASQLAEVAGRYGAAYQIVKQGNETDYPVDHSADTYLVDPHGHLVKTFPHGIQKDVLVKAIRELL